MQVFKTYFKIVKQDIVHLSIYFFIFLVISIIITSQTTKDKANIDFSDTKRPIAIFNYDKNSEFSNNFVKFLSKYTEVVEIEDKTETIQDSLFFRKVEYIVKIPNGFTKEFKTDNDQAEIIKMSIPDSTSSFYIDFLIEKYMNAARVYLNNIPDITDAQLNEYIEKDLALETNLKIETFGKSADANEAQYYYFYFFAYAIFSIIILGVTSIILSFNQT
jgi:ABC-2 type transport system permease protein